MSNLEFKQMNLSNEMQRAIEEMGYDKATEIQERAIPEIIAGNDIIGQSQTGTGKTAAFGIAVLEKIDLQSKDLQVMVLCPTRELCIQVALEFKKYGKYKENLKIAPIYGGEGIDKQIAVLKRGAQIVVGTPGRVMDHIRRKTMKMQTLKTIILDEADEMLNMGFEEDIVTILKDVSADRQTLLFSATMPQRILDITKKYQKNPKHIKIVKTELLSSNIEQIYFDIKEKMKYELLTRLIDINNPKLAVIFCNTKRKVDELIEELGKSGYLVDGIHGDMKQMQRDRIMKKFRTGAIQILIATDVMARGIDVDDIEIVFNYDLPLEEEYYVHRIGRTGRIGKTGKSFTFIVGKQVHKLRQIERYTKSNVKLQQMPNIKDVEKAKNKNIVEKIKKVLELEELEETNYVIDELTKQNYTPTQIAKALFKMMNETSEVKVSNSAEISKELLDNTSERGMTRLFLSLGKKDKIAVKDIVGSIASNTGINGGSIGKIDLLENFSFLDVPSELVEEVMKTMIGKEIKGKTCNIEIASKSK